MNDGVKAPRKKKEEQMDIGICVNEEIYSLLVKHGWNNTRTRRKRLAQAIIPSTYSLLKQLLWTSTWMERHVLTNPLKLGRAT